MKTTVTQDPQVVVPTEILASSIVAVSEGIKKLRAGRLNDEALVLLIQMAAPRLTTGQPIAKNMVKAVLSGMEDLEATYLKSTKKK